MEIENRVGRLESHTEHLGSQVKTKHCLLSSRNSKGRGISSLNKLSLTAGVDIGSTTVKAVVLNYNDQMWTTLILYNIIVSSQY